MSIGKLWELLKLVLQALKVIRGEPKKEQKKEENEPKQEQDTGQESGPGVTERLDPLK